MHNFWGTPYSANSNVKSSKLTRARLKEWRQRGQECASTCVTAAATLWLPHRHISRLTHWPHQQLYSTKPQPAWNWTGWVGRCWQWSRFDCPASKYMHSLISARTAQYIRYMWSYETQSNCNACTRMNTWHRPADRCLTTPMYRRRSSAITSVR